MSSSPDVSSYVDLTINDEDPVAILMTFFQVLGATAGVAARRVKLRLCFRRRSLIVRSACCDDQPAPFSDH